MPAQAIDYQDPAISSIASVISPLCVARGVQLVDVAWTTERAGRTLRVTIERLQAQPANHNLAKDPWDAGVTLEDCAELSRDVSQALDAIEDLIPHAYLLEVSSPGVERPLRTVADFVRFQGKLAKLKLRSPAPDGQKVLRGVLRAVEIKGPGAELVTVEVDRRPITVAAANVASAHLVFELPKQEKKSKSPAVKPVSSRKREEKSQRIKPTKGSKR